MKNKYPKIIIMIHWVTLALLVAQVIGGFIMTDVFSNMKLVFYIHVFLGSSILVLTLVRLIYRLKVKYPEKPRVISQNQWKLAKLGHNGLYVFLFLTPISGIIAALFGGVLDTVHVVFIYGLIGLAIGHALIGLKHQFIDKNDILNRMKL